MKVFINQHLVDRHLTTRAAIDYLDKCASRLRDEIDCLNEAQPYLQAIIESGELTAIMNAELACNYNNFKLGMTNRCWHLALTSHYQLFVRMLYPTKLAPGLRPSSNARGGYAPKTWPQFYTGTDQVISSPLSNFSIMGVAGDGVKVTKYILPQRMGKAGTTPLPEDRLQLGDCVQVNRCESVVIDRRFVAATIDVTSPSAVLQVNAAGPDTTEPQWCFDGMLSPLMFVVEPSLEQSRLTTLLIMVEEAAFAMSEAARGRATSMLRELATSTHPYTLRWRAFKALMKLSAPDAVRILPGLAECDQSSQIRRSAQQTLENLKSLEISSVTNN